MDLLVYLLVYISGALLYVRYLPLFTEARSGLEKKTIGKIIFFIVKTMLFTGLLLFIVGLIITIPTYGFGAVVWFILVPMLIVTAFVIYILSLALYSLRKTKKK